MKSKRILYIGHTAALGGAELAMLRLIRFLDRSKFEPIVLLFEEGRLAELLREAGVAVHTLLLPATVTRASRHQTILGILRQASLLPLVLRHIWRVSRLIQKLNVEVVHTNSLKADVLGGIAARLAGRPLVWFVHDRIAADYMPILAVLSLKFMARWLPQQLIANSHSTLKTFLPRPPRYCRVVYPGVEMPPLVVLPKGPPVAQSTELFAMGQPTIGIVGRISATKGQDVFIRAAVVVGKRFPGARFKIIGASLFNDSSFEAGLHAQLAALPHHRVEFAGFCSDVYGEIAKLDVVVHASTTPEPFGQVVVEGMACGKPVVATNAGGVREIVQDGVTGWLAPPGDSDVLAERIVWLIEHPANAEAMGRRAVQRVKQCFSIERTALQTGVIYDEVWQSWKKWRGAAGDADALPPEETEILEEMGQVIAKEEP